MDQAGPAGDQASAAEGSPGPSSSLTVTDSDVSSSAATPGAAKAPQAGARAAGWRRQAFARQAAILIGFLAAGILFSWPRASYLYLHKLPYTRDAAGFVWDFGWIAHQVTHLSNPWFTRYIAAPVGTQLGFHTLLPLPGLVMTPITLAFGPTASYNLLSVVTPGLLAYAMYRVARLWVPSQIGAVAAGGFFGLSSMLTNQSWYELNLALGALFIPLALEAAVRLRRRPGWPRAVVLGVVLGAALLTDQESAVLASIVAALALLPWVIAGSPLPGRTAPSAAGGPTADEVPADGDTRIRRAVVRARGIGTRFGVVAMAVASAGVVGSPQIIAMGQQAAAGGASFPPQELAMSYITYGSGLLGLAAPSPHVASYGLHGLASFFYRRGVVNPTHLVNGLVASYTPMYGLVLTILAVAGLAVCYRRRSAWYLFLLGLGCALLALGPVLWIGTHQYTPFAGMLHGVRVSLLMPYTWLVRLPGLSNFREAYRFLELGLAGMALLAGGAVDWLRYHAPAPVLAVVLVLCLPELGWAGNPPGRVMPKPLQIGTMASADPRINGPVTADHSSSIVVDFPFGIRGGPPIFGQPFAPQSELMAATDGHPLADALISRVPAATINGISSHPFYANLLTVWSNPRRVLSTAAYPRAAQDARRMNVGWVIVWPTHVPHAINHYLTRTGFKLDYKVGSVKIYRR